MRYLDTPLDHPDTASLNGLEKHRCLKHDCLHPCPLDYVQWGVRTDEASPVLLLALDMYISTRPISLTLLSSLPPPLLLLSQCPQGPVCLELEARSNPWKQGGLQRLDRKRLEVGVAPPRPCSSSSLVRKCIAGAQWDSSSVLWSRSRWSLPGGPFQQPSLCIAWGREVWGSCSHPPTPSPSAIPPKQVGVKVTGWTRPVSR